MKVKNLKLHPKKRTILTASIVLIAIVMIICTVTFYINKTNEYIYNSTVQSIQELAEHDIMSIESFLNNNWNKLGNIGTKIELEKCSSVEDLQNLISKERITSDFETIFLVDDKGNAYYDNKNIVQIEDDSYEKKLLDSEEQKDKMVVRDDIEENHENNDESLLYGVKIEPIKIGNITITGIFARMNLKSIESNLRIESFNDKGYSVAYNKNGDMIVNIEGNSGKRENFYKQISESTIENGYTLDDIMRLNSNNETYILRYEDTKNVKKIAYSAPIKNTQWTFVIVVPYQAFTVLSQTLVSMIISLLVVVISILFAVACIIFSARKSVIKARSDAKAKSEFLSNMSHEIRTPINGIIGLNKLMQTHINDSDKMKLYIEKNTVTAEYLLSVINEILDMSKLEANKIEIIKEPFSINEMVDNVYSMQKNVFEINGIDFTLTSDIPYSYIIGDMMRVEQVLMNILGNASKFTPRGGKTSMTVTQSYNSHSNEVETSFVISDTGCGISPEFQKVIFDAFSQERNKNAQSIKGTGLGMSISYLLMKEMGGNISVESQLGKGSTFTVVLPSEICDKEIFKSSRVNTSTQTNDKPLNILLAEDNMLNAEILIEILNDEGISVTHAENGEQVVKIFEESEPNEFDVILMDIQMPVMNGYDACKAIRASKHPDAKDIIIFACTANAFREDQQRAIESGMNDFITKPINITLLLEKLGKSNTDNND